MTDKEKESLEPPYRKCTICYDSKYGDKDGFGKAECKENQCTLTKIANGEFKQGSCRGKSSVPHNTECEFSCKGDEYISNDDDGKKEISSVKYKCDKGTMKPINQKNKHSCRAVLCSQPASTVGYNVNNIDVSVIYFLISQDRHYMSLINQDNLGDLIRFCFANHHIPF